MLGRILQDQSFDAVFTSDLYRAIQSDFEKDHEAEFINTPYEGGESYADVEQRIKSFLSDVCLLAFGHIAIVAHQAPQLALDVLLKEKTWEKAIAEDWRKSKNWQPGWEYRLPQKP